MLKPVHGRCVIQREERPEMSKGGIAIPEKSRPPMQRGEVLAVSPVRAIDGSLVAPVVQVGDVVVFPGMKGLDIKDGEEAYLLLDETDILAVVTPSP